MVLVGTKQVGPVQKCVIQIRQREKQSCHYAEKKMCRNKKRQVDFGESWATDVRMGIQWDKSTVFEMCYKSHLCDVPQKPSFQGARISNGSSINNLVFWCIVTFTSHWNPSFLL